VRLSLKKVVVWLLDRPGGRGLLARVASGVVQRGGGDGVEIAYVDRMWTRRVGPLFFPDGPQFRYEYADFGGWARQADAYVGDAKDFWLRHYEPQEGDVIVDVGAGRGEDTLAFSRCVGETGRVIAVEAHPDSFAILKSFCRLNGLANVKPVQAALMDKPGTVHLAESKSTWMGTAVTRDGDSRGIEVRARTLDDLCAEEGVANIAFLKMNIEGAERYALLGMERMFSHVRQICVACHDFRAELGHGEEFRTRAVVERILERGGFTLASRPEDPRDYVRDHVFGLRGGRP
jgi:FkbM family methyltransferase